jgi:hypothetical protein
MHDTLTRRPILIENWGYVGRPESRKLSGVVRDRQLTLIPMTAKRLDRSGGKVWGSLLSWTLPVAPRGGLSRLMIPLRVSSTLSCYSHDDGTAGGR